MKKLGLLLIGVTIGALTAKKIEKITKKYRLVIKIERKNDENDEG